MKPLKVLVVIGTRPEAIKMAPVVWRLKQDSRFRVRLCVTGQHRKLLDDMLRVFRLRPDKDLDLMRPNQDLSRLLGEVLRRTSHLMDGQDLVLVQGDTTTALGASLAAFHRKIPLGHVEAGLRSFDKWLPFPEEKIREMVDHISDILFAPTPTAHRNLLGEGIAAPIFVTGNTAVDALLWAARQRHRFECARLRALPPKARLAVITLHRRESFGGPLRGVFRGILEAARRLEGIVWVYPVHPNPNVRAAAREIMRHPRIILTPPLAYLDFVHLMKRAEFVVTDSGGIQEEAPSLGVPVFVIRDRTERPELLARGGGRLVGVSPQLVVRELLRFGKRPQRRRRLPNPFGDGRAADRIARAILFWARRTRSRPESF